MRRKYEKEKQGVCNNNVKEKEKNKAQKGAQSSATDEIRIAVLRVRHAITQRITNGTRSAHCEAINRRDDSLCNIQDPVKHVPRDYRKRGQDVKKQLLRYPDRETLAPCRHVSNKK